MIEKTDCIVGARFIVNDVKTRWNSEIGCKHNGLFTQEINKLGSMIDTNFEFLPGTEIEIVSKLKRFPNSSAKYCAIKILNVNGIDNTKLFGVFWLSLKHKVNKI